MGRQLLKACRRLEVGLNVGLDCLFYQILYMRVEKSQKLIEFHRPITCLQVDLLGCWYSIARVAIVSNFLIIYRLLSIVFHITTFFIFNCDVSSSLIIVANQWCLYQSHNFTTLLKRTSFSQGACVYICLVHFMLVHWAELGQGCDPAIKEAICDVFAFEDSIQVECLQDQEGNTVLIDGIIICTLKLADQGLAVGCQF